MLAPTKGGKVWQGQRSLITDVARLRVEQTEDLRLRSGCAALLGEAPFTAAVSVMGGHPAR